MVRLPSVTHTALRDRGDLVNVIAALFLVYATQQIKCSWQAASALCWRHQNV